MPKFGTSLKNGIMPDKLSHTELTRKIEVGICKAIRKLYEERAAKGETVVFTVDGKRQHVPAKDLLKDLD